MASVLFAHGHLLRRDAKQSAIGKPYPPLATLFAAAHARASGHRVSLHDPLLDDDMSSFSVALDHERPDVVVLYDDSFNWLTKMCLSTMREASFAMIAAATARGLPVVAAGHDAADSPDDYLRAGAAFVVLGEGEVTLSELLGRIEGCRSVDAAREAATAVAGIALHHRGFMRRTPARKLLQDLDVLPLPAWDLVDIERYRAFWLRRHGYFSLNVVTTRGCPYRCNWCAKPVYGNTYHSRSPENVLAELRLLRERYAPDHLWFCDDILGLKSRWLVGWSHAVADAGLRTPFLCQTRADLMTDENVKALDRAGAAEVWLGAESGSQRILDAMDKGISVEHTRAAVGRLRARGVKVGLFLQFGYAGEGWAEVQATRALVRELLPDDIGISVSYPLPGTRYHERTATRLGAKRNWNESSDLDPLVQDAGIQGGFSREFYRTLSRVVHAELRVLSGARELRTFLRQPIPFNGQRLRGAASLRHAGRWLVDRLRLEAERRAMH
ncbi:MAG: B12-binding domain-containing radical SAM protein [Myxococcota bacterium]|nr:B12-binding domain-containing radical SAM protein [Myxococcota bacterium]